MLAHVRKYIMRISDYLKILCSSKDEAENEVPTLSVEPQPIEALRKLYIEAKRNGSALLRFKTAEEAREALDFLEPHLSNSTGLAGCLVRESELNLFTVNHSGYLANNGCMVND